MISKYKEDNKLKITNFNNLENMLIEIIIEKGNKENLKLMLMLKLMSTLRGQYKQKVTTLMGNFHLYHIILMILVNLEISPAIEKS